MCEKQEVQDKMALIQLEKQELSLQRNRLALEELRDTSKIPRSMNGKLALAAEFSKSNLLPQDYRGKPENCFIALQFGEMLGFGNPMSCFQNVYVVKGRPSASADSMIAACFNHPDFLDYDQEGDAKKSTTTIKRKLKSGVEKAFVREHTIEMSSDKLATFPEWKNDPQNMLKHRSDAKACRSAFPEIFAGIHTADELENVIEVQDGKGNRIYTPDLDDLMPKVKAEMPVEEQEVRAEMPVEEQEVRAVDAEPVQEEFPKEELQKEFPKQELKEEMAEETSKSRIEIYDAMIAAAGEQGVNAIDLERVIKKECGKGLNELTIQEMEAIIKENF